MIGDLFLGFLKVGLFAFGGAYGAIPLIREVVLSHGWLDEEMLSYMIAVSESTPGPIMVNLATYVGSTRAGLIGALAATLAVVLPSFLIILLVMVLLKTALKNPCVQAALRGMKPAMAGIILATGVYMVLRSAGIAGGAPDLAATLLALALGGVYFASRRVIPKGLSPIGLIGLSALAGVLVYGWH